MKLRRVSVLIIAGVLCESEGAAQTPSINCPSWISAPDPGPPEVFPPLPSPAEGEKITDLSVRIDTSNDLFSGTDNEVWLDLGPAAWKLPGSFDRGSQRTIPLPLDDFAGDPLYVDDITQIRVEKKGMCGFTNAPDSPLSLVLPSGSVSPADVLDVYRKQLEVAEYGLTRAQALLAEAAKAADAATTALVDAENKLSEAKAALATLPGVLADVKNRVVDVQARIAKVPAQVLREVCHTKLKWVAVLFGGWFIPIVACSVESTINPLYQQLVDQLAGLTKQSNEAAAAIQKFTIQQEAALTKIRAAEVAKLATTEAKLVAEAQLRIAKEAVTAAKTGLADAEALAKKVVPKVQFPRPNEWKPDRVSLIVNNRERVSYRPNTRLRQGNPIWSRQINNLPDHELFARNLRVRVNKQSKHSDERIAGITTIFKNAGVSGWLDGPIRQATVTGILRHPPSAGSDGFVSLDLEVTQVAVPRFVLFKKTYVLDGKSGIRHRRFIRIEYRHRGDKGQDDARYKNWGIGQRLEVEGKVRWDTDAYGFLELHPSDPGQIVVLEPQT